MVTMLTCAESLRKVEDARKAAQDADAASLLKIDGLEGKAR